MKVTKSSAVVIVITLLVGVIAGYGIWGKKEEKKLDARQLLSKAIQEVELIENEKKDLKNKLENMIDSSKEVEKLSKENQDTQQQLKKAQQDNVQLKNLLTQVNVELSAVKEKVHEHEGLQSLSNDLKIRTSELEKENQELGNILQRIRSLTRDQKMESPGDVQQENTGKIESPGQ